MKPLLFLFINFLYLNLFTQDLYFSRSRLQVFAEVGDFGAGFTGIEKGRGLSIAFVKPLDNHIELNIRVGLRQAASTDPFVPLEGIKYYNILGQEVIEKSITNAHIGAQMVYAINLKMNNLLKIKIGASYSNTSSIIYSSTNYITENNIDYLIYIQHHNQTKIFDYTGGLEYERKITDKLSAGLEFGFFLKEGFPFGSLVFGVAL